MPEKEIDKIWIKILQDMARERYVALPMWLECRLNFCCNLPNTFYTSVQVKDIVYAVRLFINIINVFC